MKNFLSKILIVVALIGGSTCVRAQVPTYVEQVLVNSVSNTFSAATNIAVIAYVGKQAKVAVSIIATNDKPDAVNANILYYQRSVNGSSNTFETLLSPIGWTTTAADVSPAAPRVIITNLDSLGCGYIKFPYLTNACGSGTNIGYFHLSYGVKIQAP
jgi:hypothetical protein